MRDFRNGTEHMPGEPVPEYLFTIDPKQAGAQLGRFEFAQRCVEIEYGGAYSLIPFDIEEPLFHVTGNNAKFEMRGAENVRVVMGKRGLAGLVVASKS